MARRGAILALATLAVLATYRASAEQVAFGQDAAPPAAWSDPAPLPAASGLAALDQALAGGRLIEAKDLLDRLEAQDAALRDPRLLLLRAEWLIAVERSADALRLLADLDLDAALRCRGTSAKAVALLDTGALGDAELLLAGEEGACGGEPVYWRGLGRLNLARAHPDKAVAALRRAAALQPLNYDVLSELAVALIAAGDANEAADLLSRLFQRDPSRADIRINLDYARGMLGQRPSRAAWDDDMFWSRRLQYSGLGAGRADRTLLAEALLGQAILVRPRHDAELWRQYEEIGANDAKGATLVRH